MIAALGTLPFLATLWLIVVLGASVLEESGAKIAAALKGKACEPQPSYRKRVRVRLPAQRTMPATPHLRAAA